MESGPRSTAWSNVERTFSLNNSFLPSSDDNQDTNRDVDSRFKTYRSCVASNSELSDGDAELITDASESLFIGRKIKRQVRALNYTASLPARKRFQGRKNLKAKVKVTRIKSHSGASQASEPESE